VLSRKRGIHTCTQLSSYDISSGENCSENRHSFVRFYHLNLVQDLVGTYQKEDYDFYIRNDNVNSDDYCKAVLLAIVFCLATLQDVYDIKTATLLRARYSTLYKLETRLTWPRKGWGI